MSRTVGSQAGAGPRPPLIVIEASDDLVRAAQAELEAAGWTLTAGFSAPLLMRGRHVRYGTVTSVADAAAALLVVLAGSGVLVDVRADPAVRDRLLEDLRHVGPVEHRRLLAPTPELSDDGRHILRLLAQGMTLGDAAAELGIPRRTADRRLAKARRVLGVERTAEAVARARRLGWIG